MVITLVSVCFWAVLTGLAHSKSLHLPGVSPTSYNDNDPVKVRRLLTGCGAACLMDAIIHSFAHSLTHSLNCEAIRDQVDIYQDTNSV